MAQNIIEYHIHRDSRLTFKVDAAEVLEIGQLVELSGDMTVKKAAVNSTKVLGVVYGGTVGNNGLLSQASLAPDFNSGFSGARKESVTVITSGSFIYVPLSGATAGALVYPAAGGGYTVTAGTGPAVGIVVAAATKVAGQALIKLTV